jgi:hypothetical protein
MQTDDSIGIHDHVATELPPSCLVSLLDRFRRMRPARRKKRSCIASCLVGRDLAEQLLRIFESVGGGVDTSTGVG